MITRTLLAGDWHGNTTALRRACQQAVKNDCDLIIQLGDFGFGWENNVFPKRATKAFEEYGIPIWWIDGNHENFDLLTEVGAFNAPIPVEISPGCTYVPRGTVIERPKSDGSMERILCVGGAYSIDKADRVPHRSWWPQEELTNADIATCLDADPCKIVLSHDVAHRGFIAALRAIHQDDISPLSVLTAKDDAFFPMARPNRMALEAIWEHHQPERWFHGHYHTYYKEQVGPTQFMGLNQECDYGSLFVLDL